MLTALVLLPAGLKIWSERKVRQGSAETSRQAA